LQCAILGAVNDALVTGGTALAAFVDRFEYGHGGHTVKAAVPGDK
jgi:hypothetical protein